MVIVRRKAAQVAARMRRFESSCAVWLQSWSSGDRKCRTCGTRWSSFVLGSSNNLQAKRKWDHKFNSYRTAYGFKWVLGWATADYGFDVRFTSKCIYGFGIGLTSSFALGFGIGLASRCDFDFGIGLTGLPTALPLTAASGLQGAYVRDCL